MLNTNSIKLLLNLKDPNIIFEDDFFHISNIKGVTSNILNAKLSYKPNICPKCNTVHPKIESNGYTKNSLIKIPNISDCASYLNLRKQRFICHECSRTFTVSTSIVDSKCSISKNTKHAIALKLSKTMSMKDIAIEYNVSPNTVSRVLTSYFIPKSNYKSNLPKHLLFDEFKSVKEAKGAMSFLFVDATNNKIVDIIENRQLYFLTKYFKRYTKKARNKVKTIVIDMYSPYISLIKQMFPKAVIIFDKFHIVNNMTRALNKTRIELMKRDKVNYNKLKRYWKYLLKNENDLDNSTFIKQRCFNYKMMTSKQVVDYLLNLDKTLKATYEIYQELLKSIRYKSIDKIKMIINGEHPNISQYMKTCLNTFKEYKGYIINSLCYEYTNGPIEGINNRIKVIKRVSYGYRSFINFKLRILLTFNLISKKV